MMACNEAQDELCILITWGEEVFCTMYQVMWRIQVGREKR